MECTDKYDFDTPIDRTNTQSLKWDVAENELPMWVADMDFKTAPEIIEAVNKRAAHGVFGYSIIPESWNEADRELLRSPQSVFPIQTCRRPSWRGQCETHIFYKFP